MKIHNRFVNWLLALIAVGLLRLLFLTTRLDHRVVQEDATTLRPPQGKRRYCFCMWHDAILLALFCKRSYALSGLISRHQDGTYLSYAARMRGILPIRGSTSRGGSLAVRQLLDLPDRHVCITPDGPRGPRHRMKAGIVYISAQTGRPIVPSILKASRCWRIPGGWSDMVVPKPFAKLVIITGTPIELPASLSREEIAEVMEHIQDEMDRLDAIGDQIVQRDESVASLIANEHRRSADQAA